MMTPRRLVMLSDQELAGGASIAATRLAYGFVGEGGEVLRVVNHHDVSSTEPWQVRTLRIPGALRFALRGLAAVSGSSAARVVQARLVARGLHRLIDGFRPDAINVHNVHGAAMWPVDLVDICTKIAPTIWTLHDMWSFTGRCAYAYDCRKFETACDADCPTPDEYPRLAPEYIGGAFERRRRLFAHRIGLVAVCPSTWLAREARAGLWCNHEVYVIPNGVPLDVYKPTPPHLAREMLGIRAEGVVLLVVAQDFSDSRKGGRVLSEALSSVRQRPVTLLTLGKGHVGALGGDALDGNVRVHELGYIEREPARALAYCSADVLIHPALADNLPNVVIEAMACGVPCVALPVGGLPDMVRPGQTGWLADGADAQALARAIDTAISAISSGRDLRGSCRGVAEAEYNISLQASRYQKVFQTLIRSGVPK